MATYSRSQTSTQTTQSAAMPSMDISSLLVKTMENVMNDKEDSDKEQSKDNSELLKLLKDKTISDKKDNTQQLNNLSLLLSNSKEQNKDSKKQNEMFGQLINNNKKSLDLSEKENNTSGKLLAASDNQTELIRKQDNNMGKLLEENENQREKSEKHHSDLIKTFNAPLKELVAKGVLIVAVLSQLFVFLEGLMAKFIAEKDIKWIDFMSKLKSEIAIIPDKLKLSLEQVLSKVKIMGQPIFGAMTDEEKDEYKALAFDNDLAQYADALESINEAQENISDKQLQLYRDAWASVGDNQIDVEQFDLNSEEGRQAFKAEVMSKARFDDTLSPEELEETIDKRLMDYKLAQMDFESKEDYAKFLETSGPDKEKIQRFKELDEMAHTVRSKEWYDEQMDALDNKQEQLQEKYFTQGLYNYSQKKDGLTEYQQNYADSLHAGSVAAVKGIYAESGTTLTTKEATGAERFLKNQYKEWTDAWGKMFKEFKQDIGINITQKQEIPNPSFGNR